MTPITFVFPTTGLTTEKVFSIVHVAIIDYHQWQRPQSSSLWCRGGAVKDSPLLQLQ